MKANQRTYINSLAKAMLVQFKTGTKIPKRLKGQSQIGHIEMFNDAELIVDAARVILVQLIKNDAIYTARQSIRLSDLTPYMKMKEWNKFVNDIGRVDLIGKLNK